MNIETPIPVEVASKSLNPSTSDAAELAIPMGPADADMESVKTAVEFVHPLSRKRSNIPERALSMSSIIPAMELSWHGITVVPKVLTSGWKTPWAAVEGNDEIFISANKRDWILKDVYGVAYPGEVLALMGCSGAGKTTLLNVLTQRGLSSVKVQGSIRLNGYEVNTHILRRISAYVQQDDLFIGSMTVVEHLRFMALMKMGKDYSRYEREKRVQSVMAELGLRKIANDAIGWHHRLRGISGGERKRLAFASEIMTSPPILFCDEPTSGLDSYLAKQVIQVLRTLARRKNMTIIVTIHQPSSQIFELFDKICLMAEGRLAFLGSPTQCTQFWESLGYPMPENFNPADHFINSLSMSTNPAKSAKTRHRIEKICDAFPNSQLGKELLEIAKGEHSSTTSSSSLQGVSASRRGSVTTTSSSAPLVLEPGRRMGREVVSYKTHRATWPQQLAALTSRAFCTTWREPMLLRVRLFQTFLIAVLLGIVYFNTPIKQTTVMNVNGLLFAVVGNMNFLFQFAAVNVFCEELPVFMREHSANLYRVDTYYLAKNIAELPQYIIYPAIFSTVIYWMSGFVRQLDAFGYFTLTNILTCNVAISISYAMSCTFGTADVAIAVMPVIVIPLLAFGGFYINVETLPVYFYPLKYLSYFGYAFEISAINQWTRVGHIPGCKEFHQSNRTSMGTFGTAHCYRNGLDVLQAMSFKPANWLFDFGVMIGLLIVIRILAFVALLVRSKVKR